MKTDRLLLAAGALATLTALVHLFAGTPEIHQPLLASSLPTSISLMLLLCWHLVSVALAVSGVALLWCARPLNRSRAGAVPMVIGLMWLGFGAVCIAGGLWFQGLGGLATLPQWTLLLPVGALAVLSARRALAQVQR